MFQNASAFNQNISSWNTSKVVNMNSMFQNATAFNQNINKWNVLLISPKPPTNFSTGSALTLNNTPSWLLTLNSNNITIKYIGSPISTITFVEANARGTGAEWFAIVNDSSYQEIKDYASGETSGIQAFKPSGQTNPVSFNNIVTTLMTNANELFKDCSTFNSLISSWDTSNITNMNSMFQNATIFNQNISMWNVSVVSPKPPTNFSTGSALTVANSPNWS